MDKYERSIRDMLLDHPATYMRAIPISIAMLADATHNENDLKIKSLKESVKTILEAVLDKKTVEEKDKLIKRAMYQWGMTNEES